MSQPVALIARIKLSEAAFKRFLLGKHAKLLAQCIDTALNLQHGAYYVFRYLKAEQAVFAFFYFNHGNADSLSQSTELAVLKALAPVADLGMAGHVVCCLDALNLDMQDVICTAIVDQRCVEGQALSTSDWPQWQKDCETYFYREVDKDFALNFSRRRIVDKSIVKRCEKLAEDRRLKNVVQHLHGATFGQPLHFFGDYFFNGTFVYHQGGVTTPMPALDPRTFGPTPYGGADARHAVVGGQVVQGADVATFKKLQKGETLYYKDRHQVFDAELNPVPEADAASFQIVSEHHVQDDHWLYFAGLRLSRAALGAFQFDPHGYFHAEKLLLAENAVYMGDCLLPVDAASFKVVRAAPNDAAGVAFSFMYVVQDRDGEYVLHRRLGQRGHHEQAALTRTHDAEQTLAELMRQDPTAVRATDDDRLPELRGDDTLAYADLFRDWAQTHFDAAYAKYKDDGGGMLYIAINNYFHGAFQQKRYAEVLALYERIKETAWLNPHLFHHTACCFVALGQHEAAIEAVRKACVFGYEHLDRIWEDEDLKPLWHDSRFQNWRAQFSCTERPVASPELLEAIDQLPWNVFSPVYGLTNFVLKLACKFELGDPGETPGDSGQDALLRRIFRQKLRPEHASFCVDEFYARYQNHPLLHPLVHFQMLQQRFNNAHMFGTIDAYAMAECMEMRARLQRAVAGLTDNDIRSDLDAEIARNPFLRFLLQPSDADRRPMGAIEG